MYVIPNGFVTSSEASQRLGVSEQALRHARHRGTGVPFYRVGRRVLYKETDIAGALNPVPVRAR